MKNSFLRILFCRFRCSYWMLVAWDLHTARALARIARSASELWRGSSISKLPGSASLHCSSITWYVMRSGPALRICPNHLRRRDVFDQVECGCDCSRLLWNCLAGDPRQHLTTDCICIHTIDLIHHWRGKSPGFTSLRQNRSDRHLVQSHFNTKGQFLYIQYVSEFSTPRECLCNSDFDVIRLLWVGREDRSEIFGSENIFYRDTLITPSQ